MLKEYDGGVSKDGYKTVAGDESWIYAYEPKTKQQSTVWVFEDEPNPTKVVCGKSTSKEIVVYFFGKTRHVVTVPLEQCCTVNLEWYAIICFEKFEKRTQKIVHNASYRTSVEISAFLIGQNVELMGQLLHSPNLAPNDFFLIPHIKKILRGQRFSPNSNFY